MAQKELWEWCLNPDGLHGLLLSCPTLHFHTPHLSGPGSEQVGSVLTPAGLGPIVLIRQDVGVLLRMSVCCAAFLSQLPPSGLTARREGCLDCLCEWTHS